MLFAEITSALGAMFWRARKSWKTSKAPATAARATVIPTILRPVRGAIDLVSSTSDSRLIPSGVISNAHERASATGKPRREAIRHALSIQDGASKAGRNIEAA